jgi:hypothetical protein
MKYLSKDPMFFGGFDSDTWERVFNAKPKSSTAQVHGSGSNGVSKETGAIPRESERVDERG